MMKAILFILPFLILFLDLIAFIPKFYIWFCKKLQPKNRKWSYIIEIETVAFVLLLTSIFFCPDYQVPFFGALTVHHILGAVGYKMNPKEMLGKIYNHHRWSMLFCLMIIGNYHFKFHLLNSLYGLIS